MLCEYNIADVVPFVEAIDKTRRLYYPHQINMLKDAVSIPRVSMSYLLNTSLQLDKKVDLHAPGVSVTNAALEMSNSTGVIV